MARPANSYHDGNISGRANERIVREIQKAVGPSRLTEAEKLAREDAFFDALQASLGPPRPVPPVTYKWYAPPVGNWPAAKGDQISKDSR